MEAGFFHVAVLTAGPKPSGPHLGKRWTSGPAGVEGGRGQQGARPVPSDTSGSWSRPPLPALEREGLSSDLQPCPALPPAGCVTSGKSLPSVPSVPM